MKKYYLRISVFVMLFILLYALSQAGWVQIGGSLNIDSNETAVSSSIDSYNATPYVAWLEDNGGQEDIYVKYFNSTSGVWVPVGSSVDTSLYAVEPEIAMYNATPFVVFRESGLGYVKYFNGNTWTQLGSEFNVDSNETVVRPRMVLLGNTPYVTWREQDPNHNQIRVKHYSGSWVSDGGSLNSDVNREGAGTSITLYNGTPYVAMIERYPTNVRTVNVKRLEGSSWVQLGTGLNVDPTKSALITKLNIDFANNTPYVCWYESGISVMQIYVKHYNGSTWIQDGGSLNVDTNQGASYPHMAISGTIPYVTWAEAGQIYVKYYNGSDWNQLGSSLNIDVNQTANKPGIAMLNGTPYVCWEEDGNIYVKYYDPSFAIQTYAITPNYAWLDQIVSVTILADPLDTPISIKLSRAGFSDIIANNVNVISSSKVTCDFNLSGCAPGVYDLQIGTTNGTGLKAKGFTVMEQLSPPIAWVVTDMGQAGVPAPGNDPWRGITVLDTDQDGLQEVYAAGFINRIGKYMKTGSAWNVSSLPDGALSEYYTDVVADDNDLDEKVELYAATWDNHVYQYHAPGWSKDNMSSLGDLPDKVYSLALGDGDNDDYKEVYAACGDGHVYQFKKAGNWARVDVGSSTGAMYDVAVGDGNNDGQHEVYAANQDNKVYQFKYNGSSFVKTEVGASDADIRAIAVGEGDRDGNKEVYAVNADGKLYQYSWSGIFWDVELVNTIQAYAVVVGDADNNGLQELYCASGNGHVYQIIKSGGVWQSQDLGQAASPLYNLELGNGEAKNKFAVYVIGEDSHVYQFKPISFEPTPTTTTTPTITPTPTPRPTALAGFDGRIISKKHIYAAPNPIRGHIANIVIFTQQAAEVSVKLFTTSNQEVLSFRRHYGSAGKHTEKVNMSNLANGVYLLLVKAGNADGVEERVIKKIALVK
ncbi:T9SS type A sorting domain-containing protein [bacterium]|nr:T9SS type A sorting domain-containing protein [bacterium]